MRCPSCHSENPEWARSCTICAAPLDMPASITGLESAEPFGQRLERLVPKELAERLLATRGQAAAERRLVTLLFSDVQGSTTLAESLDPDSSYLPRHLVPAVENGTPPEPGDTGLELTRQYYLRVVSARDGSPAARAGLRTGDYVRAIDGASTRPMSLVEGQRRLRGPVGSKVTLTILRGSAAEPHPVEIVREAVRLEPVRTRMAAPGVGLLRIATFDGGVVEGIRNGVAALQAQGSSSPAGRSSSGRPGAASRSRSWPGAAMGSSPCRSSCS